MYCNPLSSISDARAGCCALCRACRLRCLPAFHERDGDDGALAETARNHCHDMPSGSHRRVVSRAVVKVAGKGPIPARNAERDPRIARARQEGAIWPDRDDEQRIAHEQKRRDRGGRSPVSSGGARRAARHHRHAAYRVAHQIGVRGHNADDVAETVLMNLLRGDLPRLSRCTNITTGKTRC